MCINIMSANVSIVIATYNSKKTLRRALDSVKNQSYQDWECVIVDGASKDGTVEIIKEYKNKVFRFRYISEPDNGIYDAFNKGWKIANGEWILYLGSDDELMPNGLCNLIKEADGYDAVYGNIYLMKNGHKYKIQNSKQPDFYGTKAFCGHQALIMRRYVFHAVDGFDMNYSILADWDMLRRAGQKGYKFKHVDCIVSCFSTSGVSSGNLKATIESYSIYRKTNGVCKSILTLLWRLLRKSLLIIKWKLCGYLKQF